MSSEQTFTITSSDGTGLVGSVWQPKRKPKSVLLWLHGFAEHRRRYDEFGRFMAEQGTALVALDYRGHGESEGRRGHVKVFDDYYRDVSALFHWSLEHFPKQKVVLGAHSHGGLIAARFVQRGALPRPIEALVLTGPFFQVGTPVPAWKDKLAGTLSRMVPTLAVPTGIPPERLNHDARNCSAYANDPLVFKKATAGWYVTMLENQGLALEQASGVTLPLLLIQGMEDQIVSPAAARQFFDRVATRERDKKWIPGEALYHEVLNEPERKEEFFKEIRNWVRKYAG